MGCRADGMSRSWKVAQMGCRATGKSRRWDIAPQMGYRAIEMSRRWDIAQKKCRAKGVNPESAPLFWMRLCPYQGWAPQNRCKQNRGRRIFAKTGKTVPGLVSYPKWVYRPPKTDVLFLLCFPRPDCEAIQIHLPRTLNVSYTLTIYFPNCLLCLDL